MVELLVIIASAWIGALIISTTVANTLRLGWLLKGAVQFLAAGIVAAVLVTVGYISLIGGAIFILALLIVKLLSLLFLTYYVRKARDGSFGKETRWATELIKSGDTEFTTATTQLPAQELQEVSIVAESKEELRDLTIKRYEEYQ